MKNYNTLYYLLTVLLVMGGFASMAQNSYGLQIISFVCVAFGLIFFIQFIRQLRNKDQKDRAVSLEFFVLFLLAVIFALRNFQIYFPFIEWIFGLAALTITLIYFGRMLRHFRVQASGSKFFDRLIGISYGCIVLFCLAMVVSIFSPSAARYLGFIAWILLIVFLLTGIFRTGGTADGENLSVFRVIAGYRDRFYLLLSLFLIFSLYIGLSGSGILPRLYSNEFPQAYYELVSQAETGKEKPVNGKYSYETFKTAYENYLKRTSGQ